MGLSSKPFPTRHRVQYRAPHSLPHDTYHPPEIPGYQVQSRTPPNDRIVLIPFSFAENYEYRQGTTRHFSSTRLKDTFDQKIMAEKLHCLNQAMFTFASKRGPGPLAESSTRNPAAHVKARRSCCWWWRKPRFTNSPFGVSAVRSIRVTCGSSPRPSSDFSWHRMPDEAADKGFNATTVRYVCE